MVRPGRRLTTTLSWPFGLSVTAWHYLWRILPVYRTEVDGSPVEDLPPEIPPGVDRRSVQQPQDGAGPLFHRTYVAAVADTGVTPEELIARVSADPNLVAPSRLARFNKTRGVEGHMEVGDEFVVHMPGPWDGPVRVIVKEPTRFRFATLERHLEAGQIEWRAWKEGIELRFAIESWSRSGDRLSAFMHDGLKMAKEVQLYMWTSVMERVTKEADGRLVNGVSVTTRRVDASTFA